MDELKVARSCQLNALNATCRLLAPDNMLFTDDREIRLVGEQRKHDQIRI